MSEKTKKEVAYNFGLNDECRQHIGFSLFAFRVIESDMVAFNFDKTGRNHSGFLNIVFAHYYQMASFSLPKLTEIHERWMAGLYSLEPITRNFSEKRGLLGKAILDRIVFDAIDKLPKYSKEAPFKWKIDQTNAMIIKDLEEAKYFKDYGFAYYIKALFEEYCHLSFSEREWIFFQDKIQIIQEAIEKSQMLKVESRDGQKMELAPYKLFLAQDRLNWDLVGAEPEQEQGNFPITFLSLMDVERIRILTSKSSRFVKRFGEIIDDIISQPEEKSRSKNIQTFRIQFTEEGLRLYRNDLDHRPLGAMVTDEDKENLVFTFECLESEIIFYFFKYGALFTVLEPVKTRSIMKGLFENAYNNYVDENQTD